MKHIKEVKPVLHFKKDDYVYRFVLVDRFKHTASVHHGFDIHNERTEAEIWQQMTNRKIRRKYITKE
jgi:hypothetical protein|tara:strand:+ start:2741 stop:2941 length:201 start_codon:yes stop_codon:yes gene_type:complete